MKDGVDALFESLKKNAEKAGLEVLDGKEADDFMKAMTANIDEIKAKDKEKMRKKV